MKDDIQIISFSEGRFFIRDNSSEPVVGIGGLMPFRDDFQEGHYIIDLRKIEKGKIILASMDTVSNPLPDRGMPETEMNLSEIIRNQFFKLDTDEPLAHVYVRPVYTDHKMKEKVISFVGCMRKDSALNNFPNEQVMVVENGSCKQGVKVPYGNNLTQVLNLDEMALSDGIRAYSGNATDYDDRKRSFYRELLALGLESSKDERTEIYVKHFPNEILVSSYIYDNEYLAYLKFMMNEGMEPKEAYKASLLEVKE